MNPAVCLLTLLLVLPVQAEIFKCTTNGNTTFSDQPCAKDAQTITLKHRQPDTSAIEAQQAITEHFREESRISRIHALKQENEALADQVEQLQQDRQRELDRLRERTFLMDDGRVATREHDLFEKMERLENEYQQRIRQLEQNIRHNEQQIRQMKR